MPRAQITLFLIVGFLILIVSAVLMSRRAPSPMQPQLSSLSAQVQPFVQDCLQKSLDEGVEYVANHGGYYHVYKALHSYEGRVPYYRVGSDVFIPQIGQVEQEIATYVGDAVWLCLDDFESFKGLGVRVEYENITVRVGIRDAEVGSRLVMPTRITKGSQEATIKDFLINMPSSLKRMYTVAAQVAQSPDSIPLTRFDDLLRSNAFRSDTLVDNDTVIYTIKDDKITYAFAAKYGWEQ
ncbi:hypothetical protein HY641_02055 [Candidatus Woesearchaeota archaeon]|nr:hypothetical protein [Candidatus Woesearchaeota archaeon]